MRWEKDSEEPKLNSGEIEQGSQASRCGSDLQIQRKEVGKTQGRAHGKPGRCSCGTCSISSSSRVNLVLHKP